MSEKSILLAAAVILVQFLTGCRPLEDDCPNIWTLDLRELAATVTVDSGTCALSVFNPKRTDAIVLGQSVLVGDFELELTIVDFSWDTLLAPQFKVEVYDPLQSEVVYSGVAISPGVAYTYIEFDEDHPADDRLIQEHSGTISLKRVADSLWVAYQCGSISLEMMDTLHHRDLEFRMVFGAIEQGMGHIFLSVDDLIVNGSELTTVRSDQFDCPSW